jgi:aminoglycoside phosphotransferase
VQRGVPVGEPDPSAGAVGSSVAELAATGFDVVELLDLVGSGLRELHRVAVDDCPFDAGNARWLARAEAAVAAGSVDPGRFDRAYQRTTSEDLLRIVAESQPTDPDAPVLVHGDVRLGSIRVDRGRIVAWTGLGSAGRGDAYRDLATLATSMVDEFGPESLGPFLDAYGIDHPDVLRLDWHVLLDQLLR